MNMQMILFVCTGLLLGSCVQSPTFKGDDYAFITSNYPIISVNGVAAEDNYKLDINAGENTVVVVYHTYAKDYHCTFAWLAVPGTVYEVIDQENRYPLTLYRWVRANSLWADRLDPVDPLGCTAVVHIDSEE